MYPLFSLLQYMFRKGLATLRALTALQGRSINLEALSQLKKPI